MGESLSSIGDLDGDGVVDLSVFIVNDDDGRTNSGSFVIMFMHRNGTVKAHQKVSASEGGLDFNPTAANQRFGSDPARLDQPNGDDGNLARIVTGIINGDTGATDSGSVMILRMRPNGTVAHQ